MVIISQFIQIVNHYVVHLKLIQYNVICQLFQCLKKPLVWTPADVAQLVGNRSTNRKVAGFIPGRGISLGCGSVPGRGAYETQPIDVSLTSIFPLPLFRLPFSSL